MIHEKPIDVLCYLKNQSIDVRKGALITTDFSHHECAHAAEAGKIQAAGLVEDEICDPAVEKGVKNLKAIIGAAVIDKYDLVPARDREVLKRADKFRDTTGAIKHWDHDRKGETMCSLCVRLVGLNHRRRLPW